MVTLTAIVGSFTEFKRKNGDDTRCECSYCCSGCDKQGKVDEKTRAKDNADKKALKKADKQKAADLAEEARRDEIMPCLKERIEGFKAADDNGNGVKALSAAVLREVLKFYFSAN
jgi:hypothetical protein